LENLAKFLSIAARLILIKSKALLPILDFTDEEEEGIGDLEEELRQYKLFKEAAEKLRQVMLVGQMADSRESSLETVSIFLPPKDLTKEALAIHFRSVLGTLTLATPLEEKRMTEIVTLEEKITLLQESIRDRVTRSFSHIVANAADHVHVIVSFLALLELIKQRVIRANQEERFGEIRFGHAEEDHPRSRDTETMPIP
jgi:segregation and condensation protein A